MALKIALKTYQVSEISERDTPERGPPIRERIVTHLSKSERIDRDCFESAGRPVTIPGNNGARYHGLVLHLYL
jgi:hypothetical protein